MFDIDQLVAECVSAVEDTEPRRAVKEALQRAVTTTDLGQAVSKEPTPGLNILYNTPELTVLDVVWPPLMSLFPHDHRMWAAIGIYEGREDNTFYRRQDNGIVVSGGKQMSDGDVVLLGDDVIHAVENPVNRYTGAIHVYGGDFIATPRSQWDPQNLAEEPYDIEAVRLEFQRAQQAFEAS
jgi:predicted metal-dependent enzyme (double-stranded beta helix superfamily)